MENLNIGDFEITWDRNKTKHNSKITYKNEIIKYDNHISMTKTMYVDGVFKRQDLTHIPLELLDKIKDLSIS